MPGLAGQPQITWGHEQGNGAGALAWPRSGCDGCLKFEENRARRELTTPPRGPTAVMFHHRTTDAKRGFAAMDLGSLPHLFANFTLDDSSLALIALLAGMAGGWMLTNWRDNQLRTKKLKVNRK